MALEPITRQEKIIAGQDLTPITRMEKFLKNFGGGGGGSVPKPLTYDYMPEGYPKKEQDETVIVENQTISGFQENTNLGVYMASNSVVQQAINNKYPDNRPTIKILWDGTEYECQYIHAAAPVNLAYGNTSLLGVGEDTGEPFLIPASEPLVISKTPGDSHEIKVSAVTETIHTMAPEFLPAGVGGGVQVVTLTVGENYLVVSNFTGAEIVEMLVKSPVQFISDFNGVLLPLAFIGCYEDVDGYGVVLQGFGKSTDGTKIIENMFAIPASSTACKAGTGNSYTIS